MLSKIFAEISIALLWVKEFLYTPNAHFVDLRLSANLLLELL